ncbi:MULTISPECIES: hypothetical protein [unclassified Crossiella]|uniref:hypothetical protein n=1 Tax=unclassified Crossiella TaxID=2620835 RepID=UPI001FFF0F68|nr:MULTISPECIES: hypothetical protein [unclassified Crossiella]MCK2237263.1 hypothetical protein [Crossiella sp. S99.2]MCK2250918.1 hypothetical protein [Crossiella sp. S99.1]
MIIKAARSPRSWIVLFGIVWIATIIMMISNRPERGTQTVEELAGRVTEALQAADSAQLAELVSLKSGADEAAQATVAGFAEAGITDISARSELIRGRVQLTISYQRPEGSRGLLHVPTVHLDGRWTMTPVSLP